MSSFFCILSSICFFCLLYSIFNLRSSIICLLSSTSSTLFYLLSLSLYLSLSLSPSLTSPAFQLYPIMIKSQVKIVFTLCRWARSRLDEPRLRISSSCLVFLFPLSICTPSLSLFSLPVSLSAGIYLFTRGCLEL